LKAGGGAPPPIARGARFLSTPVPSQSGLCRPGVTLLRAGPLPAPCQGPPGASAGPSAATCASGARHCPPPTPFTLSRRRPCPSPSASSVSLPGRATALRPAWRAGTRGPPCVVRTAQQRGHVPSRRAVAGAKTRRRRPDPTPFSARGSLFTARRRAIPLTARGSRPGCRLVFVPRTTKECPHPLNAPTPFTGPTRPLHPQQPIPGHFNCSPPILPGLRAGHRAPAAHPSPAAHTELLGPYAPRGGGPSPPLASLPRFFSPLPRHVARLGCCRVRGTPRAATPARHGALGGFMRAEPPTRRGLAGVGLRPRPAWVHFGAAGLLCARPGACAPSGVRFRSVDLRVRRAHVHARAPARLCVRARICVRVHACDQNEDRAALE
jgi:hypothetical protein